jgi:DNA polymerase-3 subunit epsilon
VRSSKLGHRLVARLLVLSLLPLAGGATLAAGLSRLGGLDGGSGSLLLTAAGAAVLALVPVVIVLAIGRPVARAVEAMRLGTELMATVNPAFRLRVRDGDELAALGGEINRLADRLGEARTGLEHEVRRATLELQVERSKLSSVLEALGDGVAVATPDGCVTLANRAAHAMLGASAAGLLGRSLFDFVDRAKVAHFFERLRTAEGGTERFTLHPSGGVVLAAAMTPFFDDERRPIGFVLVFHDVTRSARSDQERRRGLDEVVRELRGPLSSIRSLSESLLGEPALDPPAARRLLEAIHAEAVRLSALVRTMAEPTQLGLAAPPGYFETITFSELAAITLQRLRETPPVTVEVESATGGAEAARLRVEVSSLSGALAALLRATRARGRSGGRTWTRVRRHGRFVQIEAGTEGRTALSDLEAMIDGPVPSVSGGSITVREVVRQHAGEVWAYEGDGRIGFRITLPTVEPGELVSDSGLSPGQGFVGAGTVSAQPGRVEHRPDFYDFSLFDEMDRHVLPADRDRLLAELRCVVLDVETTGLHPEDGDRIVSLAGVRIRDGALRHGEVFDALVNPRRPIPAPSAGLHGITDAMVQQAPPIGVVLPAFLRFAEGAVLVGHEVWFDVRFLAPEAGRLGLPAITVVHPILDTLVLSQLIHGSLPDHGLDAIAQRLGVVVQGRHSALGDALATAEVFVRLLALLEKRGIVTLGQALAAARALRVSRTDDVITPGSGA